jgi:hypothetical protein
MGYIFLISVVCMAFAYIHYGGPALDAFGHFQNDLMSLVPIVAIMTVIICVLMRLLSSKKTAPDASTHDAYTGREIKRFHGFNPDRNIKGAYAPGDGAGVEKK